MCFLQVAEKNNIYKCLLSHHKTEIVLKNNNKEKTNNYTYISHTSEWRFSQVTVTGLNSFRGKIFCRLSSLIVRISPSILMRLLQNTFYVHDRNKHNITSKEIKQIVFERIAETN